MNFQDYMSCLDKTYMYYLDSTGFAQFRYIYIWKLSKNVMDITS